MKKPDANEIIEFLNEKWKNQACPMCGGHEWTVGDRMFELREFNNGSITVGGPSSSVAPVIPVVCSNCGNTILINTLATGLLKE